MIRLLRTALPALVALVLAAPHLEAQTVTSPFRYITRTQSLQVYAGYLFTDPSVGITDSTSIELGPRSAPLVGVRYNIRFGGPFSGDVGVAFAPSERDVYFADVNSDSTQVEPVASGERASAPLLLLEGGLRFHLTGDRTWNGLAPFVTAGGGIVTEMGRVDESELDLATSERFDLGPAFAVGVGVGVDYFPTERLSLRLELSERLWRETVPSGLLPRGAAKRSEWSGNTGISLGAALHF